MKQALVASDRPRVLTTEEHLRLKRSLGMSPAKPAGKAGRSALWVALAAAIAAVVGLGVADMATTVDPASVDASTPTSSRCRTLSADLVDGIEAWGSVGDWSIAPNPDPDLAALASEAAALLPPSAARDETIRNLDAIVDQNVSVAPADADQRAASFRSALSYLNQATGPGSAYCSEPVLEAAETSD